MESISPSSPPVFTIDAIIEIMTSNESISDLHIAVWDYVSYRYNGDIIKQTQFGIISHEFMDIAIKQLMLWDSDRVTKFWSQKDMDFAYTAKNGRTYRVNAYVKQWKPAMAIRKINAIAKKLDELMYTDIADSIKKSVLERKTGLFLVTWPTGSGKSTSIVAMLNYINMTHNGHLITIEDPIEFVFQADKCLISQREIGADSRSFINALKSAMREDPNYIFVWEIRDKETAEAALNLAETWHMVFSTLHTWSASSTVNRYISFFEPEVQSSISDRLADSLAWVLSQFLIKAADGKSRVWMYEFMLNSISIRNNIKKREIKQIDNIIETSSAQGMISMQWYAQRLINQGIISQESVAWIFSEYG